MLACRYLDVHWAFDVTPTARHNVALACVDNKESDTNGKLQTRRRTVCAAAWRRRDVISYKQMPRTLGMNEALLVQRLHLYPAQRYNENVSVYLRVQKIVHISESITDRPLSGKLQNSRNTFTCKHLTYIIHYSLTHSLTYLLIYLLTCLNVTF